MTKNTTKNFNQNYSLFPSHLELAHSSWEKILHKGDTVVDATAGNGYDTLFLAEQVLSPKSGTVYTIDIQEPALTQTRQLLERSLPKPLWGQIHYLNQSHARFPDFFSSLSIKLFAYNLGYLPGGEKSITTLKESTIQSIENALELVAPGGVISITCYPGHHEGANEELALFEKTKHTPPGGLVCDPAPLDQSKKKS